MTTQSRLLPQDAGASTSGPDSILARIDERSVSDAARKESRNREKYLPPLTVFRWWARRTSAVNSAVLSAAVKAFGAERLFVLDPFAGGGTIPLVALRAGHRIHAQDLNPWAASGIAQMLTLPEPDELLNAFEQLHEASLPTLRYAYSSLDPEGNEATLLHMFRVAVGICGTCGTKQRQFPYSLLTLRARKETNGTDAVLACKCGHVFEGDVSKPATCQRCGRTVNPAELYTPRRIATCPACGSRERLSDRAARSGWHWEPVLVERLTKNKREFGVPSNEELHQANAGWQSDVSLGEIPLGQETSVLLRHGFRYWSDLYPKRQLAVTAELLRLAEETLGDSRAADAIRMAIVGTTEFAGHLCRWDRFYLKLNDATAGHRFNFSTFVPEFNVWGVGHIGRGTLTRRVMSMAKASKWLAENMPRQLRVQVSMMQQHTASLRWSPDQHDARVVCGDSRKLIGVANNSVDLILTDPPYHDDVHYGELSLPFRTWAGLPSEQLEGEAAANNSAGVNTDRHSYSNTLLGIFTECRRVLKANGRLVFSYANHEPSAWIALFQALHNAGFHAVACLRLHSENETDFKKRGVNSINEDLMLELCPTPLERSGRILEGPREDPFMRAVEDLFKDIGRFPADWDMAALDVLSAALRRRNPNRVPSRTRNME